LKPLLRSRADIDTAIDDEQRFLLAVLALEAAGDGLLRTTRSDDPVFDQFARLAAKGFPVAKRLARESDVSDEAIYALGFRLLESGDGAHEDLGAELLEGIIEERPRSKLAKAAKNKLKLTGHRDDDSSGNELVAQAVDREDVAWVLLILFELAAQLDDEVIDGAAGR